MDDNINSESSRKTLDTGTWRSLFLVILISFLATSCGGGSSDGSSSELDTDNDGTPDSIDLDDDNDGVLDAEDAFPTDATETVDTDGDGVGDNSDLFPQDANEFADADADGTGDNADLDDDNDGVVDLNDAFPEDATETLDTDNDGIGNNADTDDDNDGVDDQNDDFPEDATETLDADNDGIGNNSDPDDDNDGTLDVNDSFPFNAARTKSIAPLFPMVNGQFQLPDTPAAAKLTWVIDQLAASSTSIAEINAQFDPATLTQISAPQWQTFLQNLRTAIPSGTVQDVITMTPTSIRVLIGNAESPATGRFMTLSSRYGTGLITSLGASEFPLNGSSTIQADLTLTYATAADKLETLAESVGVLIAQIDEGGQCVPMFERNAAAPIATASLFKIWVVGALAQAIEDGLITSQQPVALAADNLVLAGSINNEPLGTTFSVTDMAALMLGISDNTATEHLFKLVGRSTIEAILTQFSHANIPLMIPFLSMNEAFHLYFSITEIDALGYINGTEQEQRIYLETVLDPLGPVTNFTQSNPSALVKGTWQASPMDICNAVIGLRKFNDTSSGFDLINQAFGAEAAVVNLRSKWERVWFKGGSLADGQGLRVVTFGWLLETDDRGAFVIVAMGNNDSGGSARIDQSLFSSVASRLVDIVNESN